MGALLGVAKRDVAADAAAGAGDDRNLVLEPHEFPRFVVKTLENQR